MEIQTDIDPDLIKAVIKKIQDGDSLFCSALKRLVDFSEDELNGFLQNRPNSKVNNLVACFTPSCSVVIPMDLDRHMIDRSIRIVSLCADSDFAKLRLDDLEIVSALNCIFPLFDTTLELPLDALVEFPVNRTGEHPLQISESDWIYPKRSVNFFQKEYLPDRLSGKKQFIRGRFVRNHFGRHH